MQRTSHEGWRQLLVNPLRTTLSQLEIGGDNPCSQQLSRTATFFREIRIPRFSSDVKANAPIEQKCDFNRSVRRDWVATRVSGGSKCPLLDGFECLIRQTARQAPNESDSRNRPVGQNFGAHDDCSLHFRFYRIVRKAWTRASNARYPRAALRRSVMQNGLFVGDRRGDRDSPRLASHESRCPEGQSEGLFLQQDPSFQGSLERWLIR